MIIEITGKLSEKDLIVTGWKVPPIEKLPPSKEEQVPRKNTNNEGPTYGYPLDRTFISMLYDMLVDKQFIDKMDYMSFEYYFNYTVPCPKHLEKIHWLDGSREGVTVLLKMVFDKYIGSKRLNKGDWWRKMEQVTPYIWDDVYGNPLKLYKKSGGMSRPGALILEGYLVELISEYNTEIQKHK